MSARHPVCEKHQQLMIVTAVKYHSDSEHTAARQATATSGYTGRTYAQRCTASRRYRLQTQTTGARCGTGNSGQCPAGEWQACVKY